MEFELAQVFTDGTLAAVILALGLVDMKMNHCPDTCLSRGPAQEAWSIQGGSLIFQQKIIGNELYVGYDSDLRYGPFQITYGGAIKDTGGAWVGAGVKWTSQEVYNSPFFLEGTVMPGLYARGDGPDLSTPLQFRASMGVGYEFDNDTSLTMYIDHRSNGDTKLPNSGIETVGMKFTVAVD